MSEAKLIYANELLEHLHACNENMRPMTSLYECRDIIDYIEQMPTVDAVPVCRCCDCKWCEYPVHNSTKYGCKLFDRCVKPDWFCADGKEKSDGRV